MQKEFWKNKSVLITGHTGFKGSWLAFWLQSLGAKVTGLALEPDENQNLFSLLKLDINISSYYYDIRERKKLDDAIKQIQPEVIFHLAAQPLVKRSYQEPSLTYETNVMGTLNLLESIRFHGNSRARAIVIVTTDKCYENKEWLWGYRENDPLGGYDPYSSSKAACEILVNSYRSSFFNPKKYATHGVGIASARAGNVIGGGDWSCDRLIPDLIKALHENKVPLIRNPNAIRPWQHVLEPLSGYMSLAEKLYTDGANYSEAFNFGPYDSDAQNVQWIANALCSQWSQNARYEIINENDPSKLHEANHLKLDISKSQNILNWKPKWNLQTAIQKTVEWYSALYNSDQNIIDITLNQINEFTHAAQ